MSMLTLQVWQVAFGFTSNGAGQEAGLDLRQQPHGKLLIKEWVRCEFLLPFLIGKNEGFARCFAHLDRATRAYFKIVTLELLAIDHCECQSIGEDGTELLHQIESQGGPSGPDCMEISKLGV